MLALQLARDLVAAPVPAGALDALCAEDTTEWVSTLRMQILRPEAAVLSLNTLGLTRLWGTQPLRQKLRGALEALVPSAETMGLLYGFPAESPRRFLAYPQHFWRGFGKFGQTAWQLLRGDSALRHEAARLDALDRWLRAP